MSERPIIFSTPMVRALLYGGKTMTRRVIQPQPKCRLCYTYAGRGNGKWGYPGKDAAQIWGEAYRQPENLTAADMDALWTPPCHTDDILWVRETWGTWSRTEGTAPMLCYRANRGEPPGIKWRPSIYMPKEAARIFLRVTKVSVERLRDITDEDAEREGMRYSALEMIDLGWLGSGGTWKPRYLFAEFWESLRKPADLKQYGWKANPWVWVISFERCEKPEAFPNGGS